jgi:hypothetical protein
VSYLQADNRAHENMSQTPTLITHGFVVCCLLHRILLSTHDHMEVGKQLTTAKSTHTQETQTAYSSSFTPPLCLKPPRLPHPPPLTS